MKTVQPLPVKAPTGIIGFDGITRGGLPCGRTTLLVGGPGSGKTLFSLQFLVNGINDYKEPGIFVAFEGTSDGYLKTEFSILFFAYLWVTL